MHLPLLFRTPNTEYNDRYINDSNRIDVSSVKKTKYKTSTYKVAISRNLIYFKMPNTFVKYHMYPYYISFQLCKAESFHVVGKKIALSKLVMYINLQTNMCTLQKS